MSDVRLAVPGTQQMLHKHYWYYYCVVGIPTGCSPGSLEHVRLSHWKNKTLLGSRGNYGTIIRNPKMQWHFKRKHFSLQTHPFNISNQ